MRLQRLWIAVSVILLAAAVYAAFAYKLLPSSAEKERTVAVILKSNDMQSSYWQAVRAGAEAAAKEAGAVIDISGPLQEQDTAQQLKLFEEAAGKRPQAIVIAPSSDAKLLAAVKKNYAEGVKLILMDTPLADEDFSPVIVSNNHMNAGIQAGAEAAEETGGQPNVGIISDSAASPVSKAREEGIEKALSGYPGSRSKIYYAGESEDSAYSAVKLLLEEEPAINAVITFNEPAALGAAKALKEAGQTDAIRLIGFDSSIYQIQLMEEGTMNALIVEKPFNMGYLAVKTAIQLIDGKRAKEQLIDPQVVTKDTMYDPENQKLLFPIIGN